MPIRYDHVEARLRKFGLTIRFGGSMRNRTYIVGGGLPGYQPDREFQSLQSVQDWFERVTNENHSHQIR